MSRISLQENIEYIVNSAATPIIIPNDTVEEASIQPDLSCEVATHTRIVHISHALTKSAILPTLGLSGIARKNVAEQSDPEFTSQALALIVPLFRQHIQHFIFFLDSNPGEAEFVKEGDAVTVMPLFDKGLEPISVNNTSEELKPYICTSYLPVEPDTDYDVLNFNQAPTDKHFRMDLARHADMAKLYYPVVHNASPVAWRGTWEQRASIYDRERSLYLTLPRNYGKDAYKPAGQILSHIDSLISQIDFSADYDKEFTEMLSARLPKAGIAFMMDAPFADHRLSTILDTVARERESIKPSVLKAVYRCLGYIAAKKVHCCPECRHLDEETL